MSIFSSHLMVTQGGCLGHSTAPVSRPGQFSIADPVEPLHCLRTRVPSAFVWSAQNRAAQALLLRGKPLFTEV